VRLSSTSPDPGDLGGRDRPSVNDVNWALELRTGVRHGAVLERLGA
jgi:magnesium chelatase family protein